MFSKRILKNVFKYDNIPIVENHSQNIGGIMSGEVLSYFLKNRDRRVRLNFQIALQCAPFLKGLKVSCVISMDTALYGGLAEIFDNMDIAYHRLSCSEGKCLVLFYRPEELRRYLQQTQVQNLMREYGYTDMNVQQMLLRLSERVRNFTGRGIGFPHEIGIFLGYPLEDVKGFIENNGKKYLMIGYWKVYSNPVGARMVFKQYDRAKYCAVNEFLTGKSIREIAL